MVRYVDPFGGRQDDKCFFLFVMIRVLAEGLIDEMNENEGVRDTLYFDVWGEKIGLCESGVDSLNMTAKDALMNGNSNNEIRDILFRIF